MQAAEQAAQLKCLCCMMTDPPPDMTCHMGRDHRVGHTAGCPGCGRLREACARRPCSAVRLAGFNAFVATGLHHGQPQREHEEQDMIHAWFSRKDFLDLVISGEMPDNASLAAYALLTIWESKNSPASTPA